MDSIIDCLLKAGYYRARVSTLSDFDKIIGGMAWAMQLFSYDVNIDVFYADTLDLGQKIALTERIVMVLLASKCPYRIEPHQIIGLDYDSLLPVIVWLIKRSEELRREHEAFNRLLALRHYHRVTNTLPSRSEWCHVVRTEHLIKADSSRPTVAPRPSRGQSLDTSATRDAEARSIIAKINDTYKDNERVSFVKLATLIRASHKAATSSGGGQGQDGSGDGESEMSFQEDSDDDGNRDYAEQRQLGHQTEDTTATCFTDDDAQTTISDTGSTKKINQQHQHQKAISETTTTTKTTVSGGDADQNQATATSIQPEQLSPEEIELHRKLDLELLATNQKILNLLKKLDSMPSHLEIRQYQTRYVELHQQLIAKNKSVKKLFDLFNSLDATKHYLEKELTLLESISKNLHRVNESETNRGSFMKQFNEIVVKILSIRDDMASKVASLRDKCNSLNEEHDQLLCQLDAV